MNFSSVITGIIYKYLWFYLGFCKAISCENVQYNYLVIEKFVLI